MKIWGCYKRISNFVKSHLPIIFVIVIKSFWNLVLITAVLLPCSVQNFKTIRQLIWMLWGGGEDDIWRDLSLRCVSDGYPVFQHCPMMTSWNGNIFRVTGHLCGEFTGPRWIPHRSPVNSPHKGQWRGALMFSLICVWINDWVNNREAGDLRCHRAHCDVIVMQSELWRLNWVGN